jgi:hypothetical protein
MHSLPCYIFVQPSAVEDAHPGSFADAFFFSVETSATVGYGEMYPALMIRIANGRGTILYDAVAELSAVSRIELDVGPEPPVSGWEDRNWDEAEG